MIPAPIITLLQSAFPGQPIGDFAATSGGFSNLTAITTIGNQRCVIKAAAAALKRADVRREAALLRRLPAALPTPRLLALIEDDAWTIAVTGWLAGEHGLAVLERAPDQLEPIFHALGRLLAQIHRLSMPAPTHALLLEDRMGDALARLPTLALDGELHAELHEALAHPIWRAQPHSLTHGDAGLHNLLWDSRISALLDWEWAGWGTPLLDLAWVFWTIRWRNLPLALWHSVLAGYDTGPALARGATPGELRALALGQIASIFARAHGQPNAWEEWQRRLRWTLGITFVEILPRAGLCYTGAREA